MATYTCGHHNRQERYDGEVSLLTCGHDGTVHLACHPEPAPADATRPADWPIFLSWRTMCAHVDTWPSEGIVPCDEERDLGSEFCRLHRRRYESADA
ncbi:MAG TPA: hypothetical protein VFR23_17840 [Jiangellaceae bacterium]|nr:hypothetical protein [Jiangellaceae bacterium]